MPNRPSLSSWVCNCPQMLPPQPSERCSPARCERPRAAHVDSGATPPHRGDAGRHRARSLRGGGCAFAASLHGVCAQQSHRALGWLRHPASARRRAASHGERRCAPRTRRACRTAPVRRAATPMAPRKGSQPCVGSSRVVCASTQARSQPPTRPIRGPTGPTRTVRAVRAPGRPKSPRFSRERPGFVNARPGRLGKNRARRQAPIHPPGACARSTSPRRAACAPDASPRAGVARPCAPPARPPRPAPADPTFRARIPPRPCACAPPTTSGGGRLF